MSGAKKIALAAANAVCVAALVAALAVSHSLAGQLESQKTAGAWAGDNETRYAQISVFFSEASAVDAGGIDAFRDATDETLSKSGFEATAEARVWADCCSAVGTLTVTGSRGAADAAAVGVSGDFFLFHPYELLSGGYLNRDDLMPDRVVLSETLAWRLFGGTDLAGLSVTIGERPYLIAGVVRTEGDFASEKAGAPEPMIFMSFETLGTGGVTCYEAVLPEPVTGFALGLVENRFSGGGVEILENSARFSLSAVFGVLGEYGTRAMRVNGIIYPYWENAARCVEDWLALILALSLVVAICPLVTGFRLLTKLYKYSRARKSRIRAAVAGVFGRRVQKRREQKWLQNPAHAPPGPPDLDLDIDAIVREVLNTQESTKP